jgi:two-component system response regulator
MVERYSPTRILLVEDSPDDVEIFSRALHQSAMQHELFVARDGYEALEFLFYKGQFERATHPRPDLILLDLNLPRVSGFDVLKVVRRSDECGTIPVIILSSSITKEDIAEGYRLGANTYIQKQANLVHAIDVLGEYWGVFAKLPRVA